MIKKTLRGGGALAAEMEQSHRGYEFVMATPLKSLPSFLHVAISVLIHQLIRSFNHYLGQAVVSENKLHQLRTADICISLFMHLHSNRLLP